MRLLLSLLLLAPTPLPAFAASFATNPSADAFVTTGPSGNLSGNNYGGSGAVSLSAAGLPQGELQSVLKFDSSGAVASFDSAFGAGQWTLQSVTLQLTATPANNSIFNTPAAGQFGIAWMQNDSWIEGSGTPGSPGATGITFNSLQSTFTGPGDEPLGTFSFSGATSGAFSYSLALTPGFTADLLAGGNLSLHLFAADGSVSGVFNSRSFVTAANRPLLTIVAVPEPGTLTLGALGLVLLGSWRSVRARRLRAALRPCSG
jgi:hypothetical protein